MMGYGNEIPEKKRQEYKYNENIILEILKKKELFILPTKTKLFINKLSKDVILHKNDNKQNFRNSRWGCVDKYSKNSSEKKPVLFSKDNYQEYRGLLNKTTNKNVDIMIERIRELYENTENEEQKEKMKEIFFSHLKSNAVYVKEYSNLYVGLLKNNVDYTDYCKLCLDEYYGYFDSLKVYDCEAEYDQFCEQNKKKDKQKSFIKFIMESIKLIINDKELELFTFYKQLYGVIMKTILEQFVNNIVKPNKKLLCDEIIDNMVILCKNEYLSVFMDTMDNIENREYLENIITCIDEISRVSQLKVSKDIPSLSMRTTFTLMDINESLPSEWSFTKVN